MENNKLLKYSLVWPMLYLGYSHTKILFAVYLKFEFNWASYISSTKSSNTISNGVQQLWEQCMTELKIEISWSPQGELQCFHQKMAQYTVYNE